MILHDLLHNRESQASSVLFSITDEGMEEPVADGIGNAWAVIRYGNGDGSVDFGRRDFYRSAHGGRGLAGIQQQVVERSLELARIEPTRHQRAAKHVDGPRMMPRMNAHRLHRALDDVRYVAEGRA